MMIGLRSFILIGYVFVTVVCWIFMGAQISKLEALRQRGVLVNGKVLAKEPPGDETRAKVIYSYAVGDTSYSDSHEVSFAVYAATNVGDAIPVFYLPEDPSRHELSVVDKSWVDHTRDNWQLALALITTVAALSYGGLMSAYGGQARLLREGVAVEATVTSSREDARGEHTTTVITFQYSLPSGQIRHGYADVSGDAPYRETGKVVTYVYRPEEPAFGRLLPQFSLAQIVKPDG